MDWEFQDDREKYTKLVGNYLGDPASEGMPQKVAESRKSVSENINQYLKLKPDHNVLEVGSGTGDVAFYLADHVQRIYCTDISTSFLSAARSRCGDKKNVSFHLLKNFNFGFVPPLSVDAIYSHAVFIHLNLYDFFLYFKAFSQLLKPGGQVYFDFLATDIMAFQKSPHFVLHSNFYLNSRKSLPTLLSFHSAATVKQMAQELGFDVRMIWHGADNPVITLLEKLK